MEPQPRPGDLDDQRAEVEASGLFDVVAVRHVDWTLDYTADDYLDLLSTFSGHIAMDAAVRERLFGEIRRRIAARPSGVVRRGWGAALTVGRKRGG